MKRSTSLLLSALLLGACGQALAEKADAYKPTQIKCRSCDADSLSGTFKVSGGVELTRGTLRIEADNGSVEESPEGFQRLVLHAAPGNKVRFRQKADGPGERWMEGEADRVEYDDRSAMVQLFSKAKVSRTVDGMPAETAEGEFISYDSRKEVFVLRNTASGEDRPGGGLNTLILQPKRTPPTQPVASKVQP